MQTISSACEAQIEEIFDQDELQPTQESKAMLRQLDKDNLTVSLQFQIE